MDVVEWLLDSDPAIRWQVMRDLTDAPEEQVAAERARVASEGWGARLLALQRQEGQWDGGTPTFTSAAAARWWQSLPPESKGTLFPEWTSTAWSLMLLRNFGLDPASAGARRAVRLVRERCRWEHDGEPFFAGEVEPCINGKVVALGAGPTSPPRPIAPRTSPGVSPPGAGRAPGGPSVGSRRSGCSSRSAMRTAAGPPRTPPPDGCPPRWTRARADRADGTPSAQCA